MMNKDLPDPTYDRDEIRSKPEWDLAWTISEIMNDNAPIGWSSYIFLAQCLQSKYEIKIKAN